MRKSSPKAFAGGPKCPKCGQQPYDLVRIVNEKGKPPLKQIIWYCPNNECNKTKAIMEDSEVWSVSS